MMKILKSGLVTFSLIVLMVKMIEADGLDNDICEIETYSCGPIAPNVPESFIMKSEYVDIENGYTVWEEIYFDSPNLRAKYKRVERGTELHVIFDYDVEQVLTYTVKHPGVSAENDPLSLESCTCKDIEDSPWHKLFGYRYEHLDAKRPRMFNSYQVLHFGGNYKYAFNQSMRIADRGLPSDVYHGCLYDASLRTTFDKTFYWSGGTMIPASGTIPSILKIDSFGREKGIEGKDPVDFWYIENVPWFEGNPTFDESTFQIPRGMYCKDYRKSKTLPTFPKYFSGRLESTIIERNTEGVLQDLGLEAYNEVWYDSVRNLARVDFESTFEEDIDLFLYMGDSPVYGVYDVSMGVVYYTNKLTGECVPFAIPANFFLLSKSSSKKLASVEEVFDLDGVTLEYKGQNVARNVLCDVWAGQLSSDDGDNDVSENIVEVYTATSGWHTDSDEDELYDFPVRITSIEYSNEKNKTFQTVSETNIFKYKSSQPSLSVYDISNCQLTQNHKNFFFSVQKDAKYLLPHNHEDFLIATTKAIADYSKIQSILRVQDVEILVPTGRKNIIVSFTLMDAPQLHGKTTKVPGISLTKAEENLRRAIDNGDFGIPVILDPTRGEEIIHALPGNLIEIFPQADIFTEEAIKYSHPLDERKDSLQVPDLMLADNKDDSKDGYSSGSLAGLAMGMLIVGIALGILLMYYYIKKYGHEGPDGSIMLRDK